jgi:hypothetical protein
MHREVTIILGRVLALGVLYVLVGTPTEDRHDTFRPRSESSAVAPSEMPQQ